jgi:AraC family transcriptional regulator
LNLIKRNQVVEAKIWSRPGESHAFVDGINQDLRLSSLAAVAGMCVYHFARRFQETVAVSPYSYVLARRIERARALLRLNDERLVDVALACGFSSQSHLTPVFRQCLGVTPGEYRRRVLG